MGDASPYLLKKDDFQNRSRLSLSIVHSKQWFLTKLHKEALYCRVNGYCLFLKVSRPAKNIRKPPRTANREVLVPVFGKVFSVWPVASFTSETPAARGFCPFADKACVLFLAEAADCSCWMSLVVSWGFSSWAGFAFLIRKIVAVSGARVKPLLFLVTPAGFEIAVTPAVLPSATTSAPARCL